MNGNIQNDRTRMPEVPVYRAQGMDQRKTTTLDEDVRATPISSTYGRMPSDSIKPTIGYDQGCNFNAFFERDALMKALGLGSTSGYGMSSTPTGRGSPMTGSMMPTSIELYTVDALGNRNGVILNYDGNNASKGNTLYGANAKGTVGKGTPYAGNSASASYAGKGN